MREFERMDGLKGPAGSANEGEAASGLVPGWLCPQALALALAWAGLELPALADGPGTVLWHTKVGTNVVVAPALGRDGGVYVSVEPAALVALRKDGSQRWARVSKPPHRWYQPSAPCVDRTGWIRHAFDGVQTFDSEGTLQWEVKDFSSPATVAVGAVGSTFLARYALVRLDADGAQAWVAAGDVADLAVSVPPALAADGSVLTLTNYTVAPYVIPLPETQEGWYLRSMGAQGEPKWLGPHLAVASANGASGIAVSRRGLIFTCGSGVLLADPGVPAPPQWFYVYNEPDLLPLYGYRTNLYDMYRCPPVLGREETVYFGDAVEREGQEVFVGINPDGTLKWQVEIDGTVAGAAVDALENVYFGTSQGKFMAVNAQGEVAWTVDLGAAVRIPALGPDGRLYVGTAAGELFALQGAAGPAPSSWPQYQRNAQHTGSLESYLEVGGQGEMVLNGIPGRAYRIEWSEGLSGGWQTLTNATLAADTMVFTDPAANGSTRFYRAVLLP